MITIRLIIVFGPSCSRFRCWMPGQWWNRGQQIVQADARLRERGLVVAVPPATAERLIKGDSIGVAGSLGLHARDHRILIGLLSGGDGWVVDRTGFVLFLSHRQAGLGAFSAAVCACSALASYWIARRLLATSWKAEMTVLLYLARSCSKVATLASLVWNSVPPSNSFCVTERQHSRQWNWRRTDWTQMTRWSSSCRSG